MKRIRVKKRQKTSAARRRLLRSKTQEREAARNLLKIDGLPEEPELRELITSTGRVGDLKRLGFDCISKSYIGEVKSSSSKAENPGHRVSKETLSQIQQKARDFSKKGHKKNWIYVIRIASCEELHGISSARHAQLLEIERKMKGDEKKCSKI